MGLFGCPNAVSCPVDQPEGPEICPFSEAGVWEQAQAGWQPLHGDFQRLGFSVEWHQFDLQQPLDWGASFHPHGLEICLNLSGRARVWTAREELPLEAGTAGFYGRRRAALGAERRAHERHQFVTIELSLDFLRRHLGTETHNLHPVIQRWMSGTAKTALSEPVKLGAAHQALLAGLRCPPAASPAMRVWYQSKVLEAAALLLFAPEHQGEEAGAQRRERLNRERALAVAAWLREHLSEPVTLDQIGRQVGVSPCYLSRIFTQVMGCGIFQYLRDLRLERAAELLRQGRHNVTEAALEAGYSSLSHFSQAFRERFGSCPGLYPVRTPVQKGGCQPTRGKVP